MLSKEGTTQGDPIAMAALRRNTSPIKWRRGMIN